MKKYKKYFIGLILVIILCISICFIPIDATRFVSEVEKQAMQELGVDVHIDKLILNSYVSSVMVVLAITLFYCPGNASLTS